MMLLNCLVALNVKLFRNDLRLQVKVFRMNFRSVIHEGVETHG